MIKKLKIMGWMGLVGLALSALACAGDAPAVKGASVAGDTRNSVAFGDIQGKDWTLVEYRNGSNTVPIDRTKPTATNVYTLRFNQDNTVSGMGAPNRYFGPYTIGESNNLSIGMVAATLMAPLFENEDLKESDYFSFLGRVSRWELQNGRLELYTTVEDGSQIVLIFS